jgi:site-specific recombinase XerD
VQDKTLSNAAREYLDYLKGQGKTERTLYTYGMDLKQVEAHFGPDKKLASILIPHVSGFMKSDALLKTPNGKDRSEQTIKKTVRVFRMFLVWALGQGYIAKLPLPKDTPMGNSVKNTTEADDAGTPATD